MVRSRLLGLIAFSGVMVAGPAVQELRAQVGAGQRFIRGDPTADGWSDIGDPLHILWCFFLGTGCGTCADAADVNDDGQGDVADAVHLLAFLFQGGPAPLEPGVYCGTDPTEDELDCASFPRCASSGADAVPTARGDLVVVPIEHATLVLQWDGKAIYVDPVGGAAKFAGLPPPDLIVVTHTHGDHLNAPTIRAVAVAGTVLVVPQAVSTAIQGAGGAGAATEMRLANGGKTSVKGIGVEAVPMYNQYHAKGQGNGYVLDLAGTRVYLSGDTEDVPEMRALQDIALAFICMNLPFTMTSAQAASAALEFRPRVVYPYHYRDQDPGTDPASFKSLVEAESSAIEVRLRNWYPGS